MQFKHNKTQNETLQGLIYSLESIPYKFKLLIQVQALIRASIMYLPGY